MDAGVCCDLGRGRRAGTPYDNSTGPCCRHLHAPGRCSDALELESHPFGAAVAGRMQRCSDALDEQMRVGWELGQYHLRRGTRLSPLVADAGSLQKMTVTLVCTFPRLIYIH